MYTSKIAFPTLRVNTGWSRPYLLVLNQ